LVTEPRAIARCFPSRDQSKKNILLVLKSVMNGLRRDLWYFYIISRPDDVAASGIEKDNAEGEVVDATKDLIHLSDHSWVSRSETGGFSGADAGQSRWGQ